MAEKEYHVMVEKIIYRDPASGYSVFNASILRWAPRKREYTKTMEKKIFAGSFSCLFLGDHWAVKAEEKMHPKYGPQLSVSKASRYEPATIAEIRNFFKLNVKFATPAVVDKIIEKYGVESIHSIIDNPHAYDFLGLPKEVIKEFRKEISVNLDFEEILVFLLMYDMDTRYTQLLHQKYGTKAVTIMQQNPYLPYVDKIYDFKTADKLYLKLNLPANGNLRCLYSVLAALEQDSENNGNICTPLSSIEAKVTEFFYGTKEKMECPFPAQSIKNAISTLENLGNIIIPSHETPENIYLKDNYDDEIKISRCLKGFMEDEKELQFAEADIVAYLAVYEANTGLKLAEAQKKAIIMALTSPVCVISGGPGTGKTQTINAIKATIQALAPDAEIRACAPTGKAAIRVTELTGIPAGTIHRTLSIAPFKQAMAGGEFKCDFMFVDEFSMVDVHLCAKLFDAVTSKGRIILVGDYHQLPSVGPGLLLRDFIASNVIPKVVLKEVFRQASNSRIISNAHSIISAAPGSAIQLSLANRPGEDFYYIPETEPSAIIDKIIRSIEKLKKVYGYTDKDIQILSPVRQGALGTESLNQILQKVCGTSRVAIEAGDQILYKGDKVVHTKNNYDLEVFNGEVGFITDLLFTKKRALQVTYPDRTVEYPLSAVSELELAFTMTVHKLQGSEFPVIIMPMHDCQGRGLSKNLIYTALTRAKKMVILIGDPKAFQTGIRRETSINRKSNMIKRLQDLLPFIA